MWLSNKNVLYVLLWHEHVHGDVCIPLINQSSMMLCRKSLHTSITRRYSSSTSFSFDWRTCCCISIFFTNSRIVSYKLNYYIWKTPYIRTTIKALQLLETRIRIRMLVSLSSDTARKQLHLDHSAWSKYHDTIQPKLFLYVGLYDSFAIDQCSWILLG